MTYVKSDNFLAKKCFEYLVGNDKSSTFAPAIERDAVQIEILKQSLGYELPLQKNFLKKTSKKFWQFEKSPYLCIRFRNDSNKEEFFERFRYEQASSTRLLIIYR